MTGCPDKIFISLFLIFTVNSNAQLLISGHVLGANNEKLSSASVTLHKKKQPAILAYAISNREGRFEIKYSPVKNDTLELKASLLGYGRQSIFFVPGEKTEFNFILSPQAITLPEVVTKPPPVWQRKDTINYNTSEFKQQQDRVIGDVIARLPGIEVSPGGQIKYNGKPINKYYIEGLDLLEDKYGIANNNIPADAVDRVQVLENHQPIRVLDSVAFSDRAALNIKLKNNAKARLVGRARLGAGASPLLGEDEVMAMLFKKKLQFINTYKYNNTGQDNTRELVSQNITEYISAMQNGSVKNDLVSLLIEPSPPPVSQKRYLFNNAHVAAINQLIPLAGVYQLRLNTSYINDFQKQENRIATNYYLPSGHISILEKNSIKEYVNRLQADITLMANSPKYYLKNLLRYQGWWQHGNGIIATNKELAQHLMNPFHNLSNDFRIIKTKARLITEISSYAGLVRQPQTLQVFPGLYPQLLNNNQAYTATKQQAGLNTFYTDNYFSLRFKKRKWGHQYKTGFNIQKKDFNTVLLINENNLEKALPDTFQNHTNWLRSKMYAESNWTYETNTIRLSASLPVNYLMVHYRDNDSKIDETENKILLSPSISAMWQLSPKWNWNGYAAYNQGIGEMEGITGGYILKNYRSISNNKAPLGETGSINLMGSFTFRNPLKIIFFNAGANYSRNNSNLLYRQQFNGQLETLTAFLQKNYSSRVNLFSRVSKYIIGWKTSIAINGSYTTGRQQQLQQGELVTFNNKNYSFGSTISSKISAKLTTEYSGTFMRYFSKSANQKSTSQIETANQQLSINFFPSNAVTLRLSGEHYYVNSNIAPVTHYFFSDASARYKPKKSKLEYELQCQNLFNTTSFSSAILSNNTEIASTYTMRPLQVLFKIGFSF